MNKHRVKRIQIIIVLLFCFGYSQAQLTMQKKEDGILIVDGTKKVLKFQADNKSINGTYKRCNYIHPLWGLDGKVLTEDFPPDHLHHRGVFWAWHQVWIGNKRIGDPWELKDFDQDVVELEFFKLANGSVQLKTEVEWKSDKWKKAGIKVPYIKEKTLITVYPLNRNVRKIDFEIALLAQEEGLSIGGSEDDKGYSGFSVRMDLPEDIRFIGSKGEIQPERTAIKSVGYVDMYGSVGKDNNKGGIIIVDNPENPDFPQSWILRKRNSMQNAAWPGNKTVSVSTRKPLVLKYSLLVYSGKLKAKKIDKMIK